LGHVYSVNTIGGVLGSVLAGFVLVPFIGVQNGIILIGAISVSIGIVVVLSDSLMTQTNRWATVCVLGIPFIALGTFYLTTDAITLTSYTEKRESVEVLSYEEGIGATVKVFRDGDGERVLSIDGFPVAGTSLVFRDTQKALGHLPLLLSTVPSPRVNIVGFGAGGTSWAVTRHDIEGVDCVELVPGVIRAAGWFPEINNDVLNHPKFNLILGDGRNHALVSDETYDVISIDATSPKMAGNGSLYALEFYESLRDRVSEEGLVVQWLPLHLLSDREIRMTAKTFMTVFPHTTFWLTPFRQYGILVATQGELEIDLGLLRAKMETGIIRDELRDLNVVEPVDFLDWFAMGEETLRSYVGDARINGDNHPYLEFSPGMFYFLSTEFQIQNTLKIRESRESVVPFLVNMGETEEEVSAVAARIQERFEATQERIVEDIRLWLSQFREG
jgi:spermidine synthase